MMKRIKTRVLKKTSEKSTQPSIRREEASAGAKTTPSSSKGNPTNKNKFGESKPSRNQRKGPKDRAKSSGGNPRVQTKLNKGKGGDPIVNFGNVIQEFLSSGNLGLKKIQMVYDHEANYDDRFTTFELTFCEVSPHGMGWGPEQTLKLEDYLKKRDLLLGKNTSTPEWLAFCELLLIRLGIKLDAVPQAGLVKMVKNTVTNHLTPLERSIMSLTVPEWNTLNTTTLDAALKKQRALISSHYPTSREEYLRAAINGENPKLTLPFDWVSNGVGRTAKNEILETFRFVPPQNDEKEKEKKLKDLREALSGAGNASASST